MNRILKTILFAAAVALAGSCDNAEYGVGGVRAFFSEGAVSAGVNGSVVTLGENGSDVSLTVSLTDRADKDAVFRLVVDETVLDTYNREQSAGYDMLPADYYDLGEDITIQAGQYSAEPAAIHLSRLPNELSGTPLALPVRLEKVSGSVDPTPLTSTYVFAIQSVLVNDLAQYTGASGLRAENFNGSFPAGFTVEVRFQVSNTANRNRDVFSNGNCVLFRFEDPQSNQGDVMAHSAVQFQGSPAYINPDPLVGFDVNKWQHLAYTWDGSTGILYYNGSQVGTKAITSSDVGGGSFPMASWFGGATGDGGHSTGSQWWTGCKIMFTEARLWSVVRTADQIANNMASVSTDSEGLEGYWRINKVTYKENADGSYQFDDLTGKGHPLASDVPFVWNEDVSSEDTETAWK